MRSQMVYDIPTRIFHWLFASLFVVAFGIAKILDDDSPFYAYHSLAGIMLGFLVLLRIGWGFWGSEYARFRSFLLRPSQLTQYFKDILTGQSKRVLGHNPASSWAALLMMAFAVALGVTGYQMTSGGDKEFYEEIHELLAHGFFLTVLLHLAGIVLHTLRHREVIGMSMIDGKKMNVPGQPGITATRPLAGLVFALLVGLFGVYLWNRFDTGNQSLQLFGSTLQLGENEGDTRKSGDNQENGDDEKNNKGDREEDDDD